jgi:flagellar hook assembly protein FlgD
LEVKHGKRVRLRLALSNPAQVTIAVMRGEKVVATTTSTRHRAGQSVITWNGRIKGKFAPRGDYTIVVSAVTPSGASANAKSRLRIS